jgi:hypothetical protein
MKKFAKYALILAMTPFALVSLYTVNVIWRVGLAEVDQFGRSTLIPVSLKPPRYNQPPIAQSYGNPTYTFERGTGKTSTSGEASYGRPVWLPGAVSDKPTVVVLHTGYGIA